MMIFILAAAAAALQVVGPAPEAVLEVDTPAQAVEVCQAQVAAKDGMTAKVITASDGGFLVDCTSVGTLPLSISDLSDPPPKPFMLCRSRWHIEPAYLRPFCRLTGW